MEKSNSVLQKISEYWYLFLIVLAGFAPLLLFRKNFLIAGGDEMCMLNPSVFFDYRKFVLDAKSNFGGQLLDTDLFPLFSFWRILSGLRLPPLVIEKIWLVLLWLPAGLSIFYLVWVLNGEQKNAKFWIFSSALFYLFNPFAILKPYQYAFRLIYIAFPLILGLFIKGTEYCDKKKSYFFIAAIGLASAVFASSSSNLPAVIPVWLTLILYSCFFAFTHRDKRIGAFAFLLKTFTAIILVNLWCYNIILQTVSSVASHAASSVKAWNVICSAPVFDAFRLMGYWAFRSYYGYEGRAYPYFSYSGIYYGGNFFITFLTYLASAIVFAAFLRKITNKKIYFFGMLSILGIFLVKGNNPPFGVIYEWVYLHVPGASMFREPWAKFTTITMLGYSILFGYAIQGAVDYLDRTRIKFDKRISRFMVIGIICACSVFAVYPMFRKAVWDINQGQMRSTYVKVPDYWQEMSSWLKSRHDNRRVYLMPREGYGMAFNWEHGISGGCSPAWALLPNNIIRYNNLANAFEDRIIDSSYKAAGDFLQFMNFLRMMGAGYVLNQEDLMYSPGSDAYAPEVLSEYLQKNPYLELKKKEGRLTLYALKPEYYLERVYIPQQLEYYDEKVGIWVRSAVNSDAKIKEINFINPTHIEIKISHSGEPFWLVFSNNFSPEWKLFQIKREIVGGQSESFFKFMPQDIKYLFRKPLAARQELANNFANSWLIDPKQLKSKGEVIILIYFLPQSIFYLTIGISIFSFLACLFYVFNFKRGERNNIIHS